MTIVFLWVYDTFVTGRQSPKCPPDGGVSSATCALIGRTAAVNNCYITLLRLREQLKRSTNHCKAPVSEL